jgi:probable phosphomutase (TIGR03848 family)
MTAVLLIRHGDNDQVGKKLAGRTPGVHLNEKGRQQAQALVGMLADLPLQAIYSSPMERALETAAPLAAARGLEVQPRPAILEVDYGRWQGKSFKQLKRYNLWKTVMSAPAEVRFPDGETLAEVQTRACAEIAALASQYGDTDVVACFSHGDVIRLLLAKYMKIQLNDYQRLMIQTGSISMLYLSGEHAMIAHVNLVDRLEWKPPQHQKKK